MYVYQNKQTEELVIAVRFYHYAYYSLKEIEELLNPLPYKISYFPLSNGYQEQKITFTDKNNNSYTINNGDWLIFKGKEDYETLEHWGFKQTYKWVEGNPKEKERLFKILKGEE